MIFSDFGKRLNKAIIWKVFKKKKVSDISYDAFIRKIGPILRDKFKHSLLILDNETYNRVHETDNLNAIKAMGRSDLFLKLEIIKKIVGLVALVSTMFISVKAIALRADLSYINLPTNSAARC